MRRSAAAASMNSDMSKRARRRSLPKRWIASARARAPAADARRAREQEGRQRLAARREARLDDGQALGDGAHGRVLADDLALERRARGGDVERAAVVEEPDWQPGERRVEALHVVGPERRRAPVVAPIRRREVAQVFAEAHRGARQRELATGAPGQRDELGQGRRLCSPSAPARARAGGGRAPRARPASARA